ncbi:hypothetical protein NDN08_004486 [Rhodosorus marinus]|uniref:RRM domain-containing protein n=1 Tax=Rhodosorus marinus TaxID=101924 RepID=A0AAV8ULI7_9RHOD|nr:hypothetical protein NDN08_004486 [Rhodosorus marinus]
MGVLGFVGGAGVGVNGGRAPAAVCRRGNGTVCSMKKLFVGGISWATDDEMLREAFAQYGTVSDAKVIYDRETGRSRGFGFVTFEDDDNASDAMNSMDGEEFDGRVIRVNEARDRRREPREDLRQDFRDDFRSEDRDAF